MGLIQLKIFENGGYILFGIAIGLCILASNAAATTIYVNASFIGSEAGSITNPWNTIQEGINNATAGDTVDVSAGTYNENVDVNVSVNMVGAGAGVTLVNTSNSSRHVFNITDNSVNISGFTLVGNNEYYYPSPSGLYLYNSSYSKIENITSMNNSRGITLESSIYNTISNNNFTLNNEDGMYILNSDNNILTNNNVSSNFQGIIIVNSDKNTVSNNTASYNDYNGIKISQSVGNLLTDNIAEENNYQADISFYADSDYYCDNIIENNTGSGGRPIKYFNYTVALQDEILSELILCNADNSTLDNVTISGSSTMKNNGLYVWQTENSTFTNINSTSNNNGIYVRYSSNNTFSNNNLSLNEESGITLISDCDNNILDNNSVNSNDYHGIEIIGSSNNTIINNTVESNNNNGIYIDSDNNTVKDNTIKENRNDIFISTSKITDCDNIIENNTGSGGRPIKYFNHTVNLQDEVYSQLILCNADNSTVNNVTIQGSPTKKNNGLYVILTNNSRFTNVNSTDNYYGIYLDDSDNNTLANNLLTNNTYGIYINRYSDNNTVEDNNASTNTWGIYLGNSKYNDITNNTANSNSKDGITIEWYSSRNTISSNNVSYNEDGIYIVEANNNTITGNNLSNNYNGIKLDYAENNTVSNNSVNSNSYKGIYLYRYSYFNTITNNNASGNAYGISLYKAENNTITINNASNNDYGIEIDLSDNNIIKDNIAAYNELLDIKVETSSEIHCNNVIENNVGSGGRSLGYFNYSVSLQNEIYSQLILCNADNSNLENIKIEGSTSKPNNGLFIFNTDSSTFTNINSTQNMYGVYLWNSTSNTISESTISTNIDTGIALYEYSRNNIISNNNIAWSYNGIYLYSSSNNTLNGNNASGSDIGIYIESSANNTISNNNASQNNNMGFYLESSDDNNISNNIASSNAAGIFLGGSNNNRLTKNNVDYNGDGIYISSSENNTITGNNASYNNYGLKIHKSSNNIIKDNIAKENEYDDISVSAATDDHCNNVIENNTVSGSWPFKYFNYSVNLQDDVYSHLILCNADNSIIDNITIDGSPTLKNNGIDVLRTDNSTFTNINSLNNEDGIYLADSSNNTIFNNTFSNNNDGISLSDSNNNTISNNNASNNYYYGISLGGYSDNNTLKNNLVNDNENEGIHLEESDYNFLGNNTAISFWDTGIYLLDSSWNTIVNNEVGSGEQYKFGEHGIYLDGSNNNNISNNNASSNSFGIYLSSSDENIIVNNNFSSSEYGWGECGIYLDASDFNTISYNNASNNYNGILVSESTKNIIEENILKDNYGFDLKFYTKKESDCNNIIENNTGSGGRPIKFFNYTVTRQDEVFSHLILCNADSSSVDNVTIEGSPILHNNGFDVFFTDNSTFTNINSSNKYDAISLSYSNNNTIANSNFNSNDRGIYLEFSENNTLKENNASSNEIGIHLFNSSTNNITNNNASNNYEAGISLETSGNNIIKFNTLKENYESDISLYSEPYYYPTKCNNIIENNTGSGGRPIKYFNYTVNLADETFSELILCNASGSILNNVTIEGSTAWPNNGFYVIETNNSVFTNIHSSNNSIGLSLSTSNNNTIKDSFTSGNSNGIYLGYSNNNTLSNNTVLNNSDRGISAHESNYNTISNNTASNNHHGIWIMDSYRNVILNNTANSNDYAGISLYYSSNNTLAYNTAKENNDYDVYFVPGGLYPWNEDACNYIIENNTGSGDLPIKYFNYTVDLQDEVFSELILCNADNSSIDNVTIAGSSTKKNNGLFIFNTDNSNFTNINSTNNYYGIKLEYSNNNTISKITSSDNGHGMRLVQSKNNLISDSIISNNTGKYAFYSFAGSTGILAYNVTIDSVTISFEGGNIGINSSATEHAFSSPRQSINKSLSINNKFDGGGLLLNISYTPDDLAGLNEGSLRLYKYNETSSMWEVVQSSGVDTSKDYVYANITESGIFDVAGEPPVPPGPIGGGRETPPPTTAPTTPPPATPEPTEPPQATPAIIPLASPPDEPPDSTPDDTGDGWPSLPDGIIPIITTIAAIKVGAVPVGKVALGGTAAAATAGTMKAVSVKVASSKVLSVGGKERIYSKLFDFIPIPAFIGKLKYKFDHQVLDNDIRINIFKEIIQNPGIHTREIQRRTSVSNGTVNWHLKILESAALIKSEKSGFYRSYYPAKGMENGEDEYFIPNPTRRRIMEKVVKTPGINQTEISEEVGVHLSTAYHHVRQLMESELIAEVKDGNTRKYFSLLRLEEELTEELEVLEGLRQPDRL